MSASNSLALKGKVAIVTGASSGIGRGTALRFAADGAKVVVAARRLDVLKEVVSEIKKAGGDAFAVEYDATREEDNKRLVEETLRQYGRLDIAFNNAGILGASAPLHETAVETIDSVFNTNIKGVFLAMKYEIPALLASGPNGSIINNGSTVGMSVSTGLSGGGYPAYLASKAYVHHLSQAAALEQAGKIRVNVVAPGAITTPGLPAAEAIGAGLHLIPRAGRVEEIADFVSYLASDRASFVTGGIFAIDGGAQLK